MGLTVHFEVLNQLGTPLMYSATLANRPAAGIAGRIFFRTDSPFGIYRDTGSAWDLIAQSGGGTITGSGAATQVAFWNSASSLSGSNNLWWDSTNNYLGINTNTPGNALDVHTGTISTVAALNQTTLANNTLLAFLNTNTPLWRVGNFYTAGANDFSVFDVVGNLQQLTISNTTGQTFIGAKTTASGRLVINSTTADAHLQVVGANSPSIRIDNAGSGGTQRFVFGLATATNNFIQGATAGEFCISTQSAGNMLFGMWQTTNATEAMRISTANNLIVGSSTDNGNRFQVTGGAIITGGLGSFRVTSSGAEVFFSRNGNNDIYANGGTSSQLSIGANDILKFLTGSTLTEQVRITSSGNVAIGTSSPSYKLHVSSSTSVTSAIEATGAGADSILRFISPSQYWTITNDGLAGNLTLNRGGNNLFRFSGIGNLLVGSTSDNGNRCQITGDLFVSANICTGISTAACSLHIENPSKDNIIAAIGQSGFEGALFLSGAGSGKDANIVVGNGRNLEFHTTATATPVVSGTMRMAIKANGIINLTNVPSSSTGLDSGDIYQTAGVLNIVP